MAEFVAAAHQGSAFAAFVEGPLLTRVLIAGAVRLYRDGLANALCSEGIAVVGTATTIGEVLEHARRLNPDVCLIDVGMPDAMYAIREIARGNPTRVVALAVPDREHVVIECAEAGVAGYVTLDASLADLAETLKSVARGETLCSPRMAAALLRRVAELADESAASLPPRQLTARECEIIELIGEGLSNKQIALVLKIELTTVKNHIHNILKKMHVRRRGDAFAQFRAHRVVSPEQRI